jgi:hypothetical protein
MKNLYSWKDGWALSALDWQVKPKVTPIEIEPIERCACGSWIMKGTICLICQKLQNRK